MKKNLFMFAVLFAVFAFAGIANAYSPTEGVCLAGDHKVFDNTNTVVIDCLDGANYAKSIAGTKTMLNSTNLVTVKPGESILLDNGLIDTCPAWFSFSCVIKPSKIVQWIFRF